MSDITRALYEWIEISFLVQRLQKIFVSELLILWRILENFRLVKRTVCLFLTSIAIKKRQVDTSKVHGCLDLLKQRSRQKTKLDPNMEPFFLQYEHSSTPYVLQDFEIEYTVATGNVILHEV